MLNLFQHDEMKEAADYRANSSLPNFPLARTALPAQT
jgi:hypothetical protein